MLPRMPKIGHSRKSIFPECCTRGSKAFLSAEKCMALGKGHLPRVQHSRKRGTREIKFAFDGGNERSRMEKFFPECLALAIGEAILFPECLTPFTFFRLLSGFRVSQLNAKERMFWPRYGTTCYGQYIHISKFASMCT
jgi:hypothetical protein